MKSRRRVVALLFTSTLVEHGLAWVLSHLGNFGRPQPPILVPQKTTHLLLSPERGRYYNHHPILLWSTAPRKGRSKKVKDDYLENHLEDAYRIAREEDDKWFKTILSDLLEHESGIEAEVFKMPRKPSKLSQSAIDVSLMVPGDNNNETLRSLLDTKVSGASPIPNMSSSSLLSSTNAASSSVIGFVNDNGRYEEVPLKDLTKLGYKLAEIKRLKSSSIVAILTAGVCRPKGGISKNWTVRSRGESEVKISCSLTPTPHNQSTVEREFQRRRQENFIRRPSIKYSRQTGQNAKSDETMLHARRKQSTRSTGISRGSTFRPRPDNAFTDGEVWMDLPTFRAFLRKEAQLRLTILGPGWSNAVKGESRWRLEIYQKWLDFLHGDENESRGKRTHRQRRGRGAKERQRKNTLKG